jgi:hypothetical protein
MEIKSNGKYTITYKNIEYNFEGGNSYEIDEETAKQFVESGYCSYAKLENDKNQSKKTNKNIK